MKAETDRTEAQLAQATENGQSVTGRRGRGELWDIAQQEIDEEAL